MPASHLTIITNDMILVALRFWKVSGVSIEWLFDDPADAEKQTRAANVLLAGITSDDVWSMLDRTHFRGDSAADEIDWAIGLCCEPEGMDAGCVVRKLKP